MKEPLSPEVERLVKISESILDGLKLGHPEAGDPAWLMGAVILVLERKELEEALKPFREEEP